MTITYPGIARTLQLGGLAGSILGLIGGLLSGNMVLGFVGALAVGMDLLAVTARRLGPLTLAAGMKVLVVFMPVLFFVTRGARVGETAPLVDPGLVYAVLWGSAVLTVLGAVGRWVSR